MGYMFRGCKNFNQPLYKWGNKLNNLQNMSYMFADCKIFDQDLSSWTVYCDNENKWKDYLKSEGYYHDFEDEFNKYSLDANLNYTIFYDTPMRNKPSQFPKYICN